jgi:hypothetical protein
MGLALFTTATARMTGHVSGRAVVSGQTMERSRAGRAEVMRGKAKVAWLGYAFAETFTGQITRIEPLFNSMDIVRKDGFGREVVTTLVWEDISRDAKALENSAVGAWITVEADRTFFENRWQVQSVVQPMVASASGGKPLIGP